MSSELTPEIFEAFRDGVSSADEPELIYPTQLAWATNARLRGGKPQTRPPMVMRALLPPGLVQGASSFSIQNGMIIVSVSGAIHRVNVSGRRFAVSRLTDLANSSKLTHAWMTETAGSIVIQDGQSDPIIYDGSKARRSDRTKSEVPVGRMMAYGNGRLWVVINENEIIAGDIKIADSQSELQFTETGYLDGGGAFYFPRKLNGVAFVPTATGSGQGGLLVFGNFNAEMIRADITSRDLWSTIPNFVGTVLRQTGASGHGSIVEVNQDLYWRDAQGGIRSLSAAMRDELSAGSVPISREVSRLTEYESPELLEFCSSVIFDNRLIMTASPYRNKVGGVSFRNLISLDFAPLSNRTGKAPPAYDGQWNGVSFTHLFDGIFAGVRRAFGISCDKDGQNRLWEFVTNDRDDSAMTAAGTKRSPIKSSIEYQRRNFGSTHLRKQLTRFDVYLSGIEGPVTLDAYWRVDNDPLWVKWDSVAFNAKMTYPEPIGAFKNLTPQHRAQVRSFTIPPSLDAIQKRARNVGVEFQLKLVWTGKMKIHRSVLWANTSLPQDLVANRDEFSEQAIMQDVTTGEIPYSVPLT